MPQSPANESLAAAADLSAASDQLQSADPAAWPVVAGWQPLVDGFFQSAPGQGLLAFLNQRLEAGAVIFPPFPLRAHCWSTRHDGALP